VTELRDRALDALVAGDTAGGIADLKAHLAAAPDDAEAWLTLAEAYASIAHLPEAEAAARRAAALGQPEARAAHGRALAELGVAAYAARRYDEAASFLEEAVGVAPERARSHFALGMVREAQRDAGGAVAAYREAVRRDPAFLDARRTLADALATLGEHEAAMEELGEVLRRAPRDEQAAHNREVLGRALAEMQRRRLLGRTAGEVAASVLVEKGALRDKGEGRFAAPLLELQASCDAAGAVRALRLVLRDPARAARTEDDAFQVTVISADGRAAPADLGTAATLTFLREALGCPLTTASALYARLLAGAPEAAWGDALVRFEDGDRPGLVARLKE
jgi:tetratricopeptide (TPR) repeat protein